MFTTTGNTQIDRLNELALKLAKGGEKGFGVLSTGEKCYVGLAANRIDLLNQHGYTITEALNRIGPSWITSLIISWRYAGNPANTD